MDSIQMAYLVEQRRIFEGNFACSTRSVYSLILSQELDNRYVHKTMISLGQPKMVRLSP